MPDPINTVVKPVVNDFAPIQDVKPKASGNGAKVAEPGSPDQVRRNTEMKESLVKSLSPSGASEKGISGRSLSSRAVSERAQPAKPTAESAVDSFMRKTDAIRDYINAKCGGELELNSELSAKINARVNEWLDTLPTLVEDGVSAEELDRAREDTIGELMDLIDKEFPDSKALKTEAKIEVPKEAPKVYSSRAAEALTKSTGKDVPAGKTHVYQNDGGGSCLFHSVLQLLAKSNPSNYPTGNHSKAAMDLRGAIIKHARDLKQKVENGETRGMKSVTVDLDGKKVTHIMARVGENDDLEHMQPITEGYSLAFEKSFEDYATYADVSTGALLADYLQRPVTVITQDARGSVSTTAFNYGLASGEKLDGEPLTIYYDQAAKHFMAVSVDDCNLFPAGA